MEFDLQQFEFLSRKPYIQLHNGNMFRVAEKRNSQKVFTLCIFDGAEDQNNVKKHIHCQSLSQGVVKIKGYKIMDSKDEFGFPVIRRGYLYEEIKTTLNQLINIGKPDEATIIQLMQDVILTLAQLQSEEIALPYLIPEHIVQTKDGSFKLIDLTHAINVLGMEQSVSREIKSDIHYMDPDTFAGMISGQSFLVQNYFKSVVYSVAIIVLEFTNGYFYPNRETEEQLNEMKERLIRICGPQINVTINLMLTANRRERPDCIALKKQMPPIPSAILAPPKLETLNWGLLDQFTHSQPIHFEEEEEEEEKKFRQTPEILDPNEESSLEYSQNLQTMQNSSGIKLSEGLRNQIKQWQEKRQQSENSDNKHQQFTIQEYDDYETSSDQISNTFQETQELTFQTLYEMLMHLKVIPFVSNNQININQQYNIDQKNKIFRCQYAGEEMVVKIYRNVPNKYLLQMLFNISSIMKLNIKGICHYDCYTVTEGDVLGQANLFLITKQMNCDLGRAISSNIMLVNKKDKISIIMQIASALSQLNNQYIHGSIKPSNILLNNDIKVHIIDYGYSEVVEEGEQLLLTNQGGVHTPPEKRFHNQLSKNSDVWSFGLIIHEILTGTLLSMKNLTENNMLNINLKGCLNSDKLDNPRLTQLIRQMTHFDPLKRPSSSKVQEELDFLFQQSPQTPQTPVSHQSKLAVQRTQSNKKLIDRHYQLQSARNNRPQLQSSQGFFIQGNTINLQPQTTQVKQKK